MHPSRIRSLDGSSNDGIGAEKPVDQHRLRGSALTEPFGQTWHEVIGEPTFADAILDRLVHNAYRIALDGPSLRKAGADSRPEAAE